MGLSGSICKQDDVLIEAGICSCRIEIGGRLTLGWVVEWWVGVGMTGRGD
jgi:hypothetical protein